MTDAASVTSTTRLASARPRTYFVGDAALLQIPSADTFEFEAVSKALAEMLASVEPPFSIAILGPWGSGKTSLVNDVVRRITPPIQKGGLLQALKTAISRPVGSRDAVVYIDAWKYEDDSLRRQLLVEIERQLQEAEIISSDVEAVSSRLYQETATTKHEPPQVRWVRAPLVTAVLALMWLGTVSIAAFGQPPLNAIGLGLMQLVTGVTLYLLFTGQELFRRVVSTVKAGPLVSPEQFELEFRRLTAPAELARLFLVLDNLDRMAPDAAIRALATMKTYLEPTSNKGVFIVPLDDSALRAHLRTGFFGNSGRDEDRDVFAREYLRKFFGATIRVPPLSTRELVRFGLEQLRSVEPLAGVADATLVRVAELLAAVPGTTPRRVKRHVNALSARVAVLQARSQLGEMQGPNPGDVLCLAMLTVIEEEWPDLFAQLESSQQVLQFWKADVAGTATRLVLGGQEKEVLTAARAGEQGRFIAAVLPRVDLTRLRMLFRLKLDTAESAIDDYETFVEDLERGSHDLLQQRLKEADVQKRRGHLDVATEVLRRNVERSYWDTANNVARAVLEVPDAWGSELETDVVDRFAETYARYGAMRGHLLQGPSVQATVWLGARAKNPDRGILLAHIASVLEDRQGSSDAPTGEAHLETVVATARSLAAEHEYFTAEELEAIRNALSTYPASRDDLAFLWSAEDKARKLLSDSILAARIEFAFSQPTGSSPLAADSVEALFALRVDSTRDHLYAELVGRNGTWLAAQLPAAPIEGFLQQISVARWPTERLDRDLLSAHRKSLLQHWSKTTQTAVQLVLQADLLRLRQLLGPLADEDTEYVKVLAVRPVTDLQALTQQLSSESGVTAADLLLRVVDTRLRTAAPGDRAGLVQLGWQFARQLGPQSEVEAAADWLPVATDEVATERERLAALLPAVAGRERFEMALVALVDETPPRGSAVELLAGLPSLVPTSSEALQIRILGQLQNRARRTNGEQLLAQGGHLLSESQRAEIWLRIGVGIRDQLRSFIPSGSDWTPAADEMGLLQGHRDELPAGVVDELEPVLRDGAAGENRAVRLQALRWTLATFPSRSQGVRDQFAQRLGSDATEDEVRELIRAAEATGASDIVRWKLGEIGASDSSAAPLATEANERFSKA